MAARRSLGCPQGLVVCLALSGCMRAGYDLSTENVQGTEPFTGLTPTSSDAYGASRARDGGLDAAPGSASERLPFASDPSWDPRAYLQQIQLAAGGRPPDPPGPGPGAPDSGSSPAPQVCQLSGNEQVVNGFDAPTAGLQARGSGSPTLSWTGSAGNPNPGAIEFANAADGGEIYYPGSLGDLRGRMLSLNVQVAQGSNVRFRLFVESGAQRRRASGAFASPPRGAWDCSLVVPDAPISADSGFDASNIVGAGLEIQSSAAVRVVVDQIAY